MRRVARLSERAADTLRLASIFPDHFSLARLRLLADRPDAELLEQVDEALGARVVVTREAGYAFAHALLRRALYDGMNPDRRARLHRRVAEQLQSAGDDAGEIARHYHASRRLAGAEAGVAFAQRAAERALVAQHHEHHAVFLRIAVELGGEGADVASLRDLALAQAAALDIDAAESTGRRVVEQIGHRATSHGHPPWLYDFLATLARRLRDAGAAPATWLPFVDLGLAACADRRDLAWARLSVLRPRWRCQWDGLVFKPVHFPSDPLALDILRKEGDEDDIAETLDAFEPRTVAETEEVRRLAERWTSAAAIIHARVIVASDSAYRHDDMRVAAERWRELARESERLGSLQGRAHGYLHLAATEADLGRIAASEEALREVGPLVAKLGASHRHHVAYELAVATLVPSLHRGSWEAMRRTASRTMERLVGHQTPIGFLLLGYSAMAEAFSEDASRYEERIEALAASLEGSSRSAFLEAVAVLDVPREDVRDGLHTPVRVPRKTTHVVCRGVRAEVVEEEERVVLLRRPEPDRSVDVHARALDRVLAPRDLPNPSDVAHGSPRRQGTKPIALGAERPRGRIARGKRPLARPVDFVLGHGPAPPASYFLACAWASCPTSLAQSMSSAP
jgi:hypothetical protein